MLRRRLSLALIAAVSASANAQTADDAAYRAATGLLHRDMPEQAAAEYRAFLRESPSHARADLARYGLAVCLTRLSKWEEAAKELDQLVSRSGFEFAPDCLLLRAQCHLNAKEQAAAIECLERMLREYAGFAQADTAGVLLGELCVREGRAGDARTVLSRFERDWPTSPSRPRAEFLLSSLDAADGKDAAAADRLARLRRDAPGNEVERQAMLAEAQARHRIAVSGPFDAREAERAAALYRSLADAGEADLAPDAMLGLAQLTRASGDAAKAGRILDDLLTAHGRSPVSEAARVERARAYLDENKPERALTSLEPLLQRPVAPADASHLAAKAELRMDRFAAAADRLARAAAAYPESPLLPAMLFDRAVALSRDGKPGEAADLHAQVRSRFPANALAIESLAAMASIALQEGDADRAAELCRTFLRQHATHSRAGAVQLVLAESLSAAGKDTEAAAQYRDFVSAHADDPRSVEAALRRGLALARAGHADAAGVLEQALASPGQADEALRRAARTVLADSAIARADWSTAEKWLLELTRTDATPDSLLKLGVALQRQGRTSESLDLFARVVERAASDPAAIQARFERAQILVEQEKLDAAKGDFDAVVIAERDSHSHRFTVHALRHLASIASQQNRADDAAALLARIADSPEAGSAAADALYERGAALLSAGQYQQADEAFAKFLATSPSHPRAADAAAQRAIAASRMGQCEQALPRLDEADTPAVRPEVLAALRYERAWALKSLGRLDEARAAYERALSSPLPPALEAHASLDLAQLLVTSKQHVAAAPALARALKAAEHLAPTDAAVVIPHSLYLRGVCGLMLNTPADAASALDDLLSRFPKSEVAPTAHLLAGQALIKLNKAEAAAEHLESAIGAGLNGDSLGSALLFLGEARASTQQWDKSHAAFEQHLRQFPTSELWFQAQFGVAWALEHQGRHAEAISAYRDVITRHTGATAARAQFQVGECLFGQKQYDEAVRELLKVDILYAYPEWSAAALYEAGRCLAQLNKTGEARTQFTQVTERFKDTQWARLAAEQLQKTSAAATTLPGRAAAESR